MSQTVLHPAEEQGIAQKVFAEKIRLLYANQERSYVLSLATAAALSMMAIQNDVRTLGIVWWLAFFVIATARYVVSRRYKQAVQQHTEAKRWARYYTIGATAAGISWGVGSLLIIQDVPLMYQMAILFLVYGIGSAAVPLLGMHSPAMIGFQIPLLAPATLWAILSLNEISLLISYIMLLYLSGIRISREQVEDSLDKSLSLQFENELLVASLNETNKQLTNVNQELNRLSSVDSLTGIPNRRYYEEQLVKEWRRAFREGTCLSLIVVDIDSFKDFNDNLGHSAGDKCLYEVAQLMQNNLNRPADFIARYGGEEFVILLPRTSARGALTLANHLRDSLHKAALPHPFSNIATYITASFGVSSIIPADDVATEALFRNADRALYDAKSQGRDRVVLKVTDQRCAEQLYDNETQEESTTIQ